MGSENLHEESELLSEATKNMHRALVSLREELEAVDWYGQRAEACSDAELTEILQHNKREEIEHAMMTLEWIRRQSKEFAGHIKTYINGEGPILELEEKRKRAAEGATKNRPGKIPTRENRKAPSDLQTARSASVA